MKLYARHIAWNTEIVQNHPELPFLVMLHGFMGSGNVFDPLKDALSKFCNPVTLDLIGHGRSGGSADPERYRTENLLSDLKSVLYRLHPSPFYLYGYSMGGRLALQFALNQMSDRKNFAPEESLQPDGLILESTTPGISRGEDRRQRVLADEKRAADIVDDFPGFLAQWVQNPLFTGQPGGIGERAFDKDTDDISEVPAGAAVTNHPQGSHEKHKDAAKDIRYTTIMRNQNPAWLAACLQGFSSGKMPPVSDKLKFLEMPVLLVSGEKDAKFTDIHRRMLSEIPNASISVIQGAAHRVHRDQPRKLLTEIENFIKRNRP